MPQPTRCKHCGDLLDDVPPTVDTCRKRCAYIARQRGDTLTEDEARRLEVIAFLCAWEVAIDKGLEIIPKLD